MDYSNNTDYIYDDDNNTDDNNTDDNNDDNNDDNDDNDDNCVLCHYFVYITDHNIG